MKFAPELFPKGTFANQQTDGAYLDETLSKNLDVIAESMHKDIFPVLIYSGNNTSGTGKSTCATQHACYLTYKINQTYNSKNTFTSANVFFKVDDMLKAAPKFASEQPYSVMLLDEPDDLNENQLKKKAFELRSAFRKLRQLNLIFMLTSHSFFELPKFYALNRAQCLVNVEFQGKFDRGFFKFYGPKAKKLLYFRGKKEWDYDAAKPDFDGRFAEHYAFFPNCKEETAKYKKKKYLDMVDELNGKNKPVEINERNVNIKICKRMKENLPKLTLKELGIAFSVTDRTIINWLNDDKEGLPVEDNFESETKNNYTNNLILDEKIIQTNPKPEEETL